MTPHIITHGVEEIRQDSLASYYGINQPHDIDFNKKIEPFKPSDAQNIHYQYFAEAGARGGKISKRYNMHRRTLIAQLVQNVLYKLPYDNPVPATHVASSIHAEFVSEVHKSPEIFGSLDSFGSRGGDITDRYIDFLAKTIRKMARNGLKLAKSYAAKWHPAPGLVYA